MKYKLTFVTVLLLLLAGCTFATRVPSEYDPNNIGYEINFSDYEIANENFVFEKFVSSNRDPTTGIMDTWWVQYDNNEELLYKLGFSSRIESQYKVPDGHYYFYHYNDKTYELGLFNLFKKDKKFYVEFKPKGIYKTLSFGVNEDDELIDSNVRERTFVYKCSKNYLSLEEIK